MNRALIVGQEIVNGVAPARNFMEVIAWVQLAKRMLVARLAAPLVARVGPLEALVAPLRMEQEESNLAAAPLRKARSPFELLGQRSSGNGSAEGVN